MADGSTPAWLQENTTEAPAAAPLETEVPVPAAPAATTAAAATAADEAELPSVILFMRLANMAVAVAMIAVSIWKLIGLRSISAMILAVYATCGGILICCLETQLKFVRVIIAINFGFLFHSVWRFIFYLMMGSVAWSYSNLLGYAVGGAFVFVAFFNAYVLCRYPSYRKVRDEIAKEEDKRIEARISKEVKKQAAKQAFGGS